MVACCDGVVGEDVVRADGERCAIAVIAYDSIIDEMIIVAGREADTG
jgi:hypothetical protein